MPHVGAYLQVYVFSILPFFQSSHSCWNSLKHAHDDVGHEEWMNLLKNVYENGGFHGLNWRTYLASN